MHTLVMSLLALTQSTQSKHNICSLAVYVWITFPDRSTLLLPSSRRDSRSRDESYTYIHICIDRQRVSLSLSLSQCRCKLLTCSACASTPPCTSIMLSGSSPRQPDTYTVSPTRMACEYGPSAAGALSDAMTVFDAVVADAELARTGITRVKRARFDALRLATERKILIVATISLLVNSSFVVYIYIYISNQMLST